MSKRSPFAFAPRPFSCGPLLSVAGSLVLAIILSSLFLALMVSSWQRGAGKAPPAFPMPPVPNAGGVTFIGAAR